MIFYEWLDPSEGEDCHVYTTLSEARKEVRGHLSAGRGADDDLFNHGNGLGPFEIMRIDVGKPTKERVCAMLNRQGYVVSSEVVETWEAVPCGACTPCQERARRITSLPIA